MAIKIHACVLFCIRIIQVCCTIAGAVASNSYAKRRLLPIFRLYRHMFCQNIKALIKAKPSSAKGVYIQSITLSATMTPGVKVDIREASVKETA